MCGRDFPHTTEHFSRHQLLLYNSIQSWHQLPRDSIRFYSKSLVLQDYSPSAQYTHTHTLQRPAASWVCHLRCFGLFGYRLEVIRFCPWTSGASCKSRFYLFSWPTGSKSELLRTPLSVSVNLLWVAHRVGNLFTLSRLLGVLIQVRNNQMEKMHRGRYVGKGLQSFHALAAPLSAPPCVQQPGSSLYLILLDIYGICIT